MVGVAPQSQETFCVLAPTRTEDCIFASSFTLATSHDGTSPRAAASIALPSKSEMPAGTGCSASVAIPGVRAMESRSLAALRMAGGWKERGSPLCSLSLSLYIYIYAHYQNAVNCEGLLASAYGLGFRLLWVAGVSTRTLAQGRHTSFLKLYSNAYTLLQIP